jgi:hypothetical protein
VEQSRLIQPYRLRNVPPVAPATPEEPAVESTDKGAPNANPAVPNADPAANPDAVPNLAAPNANPADPAINLAAAPAQPAAPNNPAVTANPAPPPAAPANPPASITVQWIETWIGGRTQTWVPRTVTFNTPALITQAPHPGKGEIGMGTLTGQVGVTKTVVAGGAPTRGVEWMVALMGLVAAAV